MVCFINSVELNASLSGLTVYLRLLVMNWLLCVLLFDCLCFRLSVSLSVCLVSLGFEFLRVGWYCGCCLLDGCYLLICSACTLLCGLRFDSWLFVWFAGICLFGCVCLCCLWITLVVFIVLG